MPEVALFTLVPATLETAAVVITAGQVATAAFLVGSQAYAARQRKKAKGAYNDAIEDRRFTTKGSAEPQQIILGRVRAGGVQMAPGWTWGARSENWTVPIAFAGHRIAEFEEVWLADESVGTLDGDGKPVYGSKYFKTSVSVGTTLVTGGAPAATYTFSDGAATLAVDSIAYEVTLPNFSDVAQTQAFTLAEGVDYSIARVSGNLTITWITTQVGRTLTVTTRRYTDSQAMFRAKRFLGIPAGERDTELETNSGGEWLSTDIGCEIARIHATFTFDQDVYPGGAPNLSAIMKGALAYDPRLDSTYPGGSGSQRIADESTWAWTSNPALLWAWYMTQPIGFGCATSRIDWPSVVTAANICDETVATGDGGTQRRFECNGVLSTAEDRRTNVDRILATMVGMRFYSGGKWYCRAGAYVSPVLDLTEDDFADGTIQIMPRVKRRDLFNSIGGTYSDASNKWAPTSFPLYASSTYVTQDGGEELWSEIELPLVTDWRQAQRIALQILNRARQALTITAQVKLRAMKLQPGDTFRLTSPTNGWTNKIFRVSDWQYTPHGTIGIVAQEEASAVYSWGTGDENAPDPAPNTDLPDPRVVYPLGNFRLSAGGSYVLPDGTSVGYTEATWDAVNDSAVLSGGRIELWWKRAIDTAYRKLEVRPGTTSYRIEPVSGGDTINAVAWVFNGAQVRSTPAFATQQLDAGLPGNVVVPALSANLLRNATLDVGVAGWTLGQTSGLPAGSVSLQRHDVTGYYVPGSPSSAYIAIQSSLTGGAQFAYAQSDPFSVSTGRRYVGACDLVSYGTDSFIGLAWYDGTDTWLGTVDYSAPISGNLTFPGGVWSDPAQYRQAAVFATAPPGARRGRLIVYAWGNWAAPAQKYASFHRPFAGQVALGVTDVPPWDPGGQNVVDTALIGQAAATKIYRIPAVIPGPIPFYTVTSAVSSVVVAEDLRGFDVAATITLDYTARNAGGVAGVIGTTMAHELVPADGVVRTGPSRTLIRSNALPAGYDVTQPVELTQRWLIDESMAPPYTFRVRASDKFAVVGGLTQSNATAIDFAVEVVKR